MNEHDEHDDNEGMGIALHPVTISLVFGAIVAFQIWLLIHWPG